jgi:hypothetical protein
MENDILWPFKLSICCNLAHSINLDRYVECKIKSYQNISKILLFDH